MTQVFDCRMCGHCCEGQGGIVVSPKDLKRICDYLQVSAEQFIEQYAFMHNGKLKVRSADDGNCIFFRKNQGCAVHEGKPDICRAWPFFRGNMLDNESLYLAKDYCPGIRSDASHEEFIAEGQVYLKTNKLQASQASNEAHALLPVNYIIES